MKNNLSNTNSLKDKISLDINKSNPDVKDIGITLLNTALSEPKLKRKSDLKKRTAQEQFPNKDQGVSISYNVKNGQVKIPDRFYS